MKYKFPHITDLSQVEKAIAGRDEFIVAERDFGYVVNYLVNLIDTFPTPDTKDAELNERYVIRRECRGIKFDKDGKILARPYHKFFNCGERPETEAARIDFDAPFAILDKLDGSMVHPINFNNQVVLCTKMGITDVVAPVQKFAEVKGHAAIFYLDFCWDLMKSGMTPLFEWCSRQQRIVVDYPEDQLILTAVREMESGKYLNRSAMEALATPYRVPLVNEWAGTFEGIKSFLDEVQENELEEGYVLRFNDGHALKVKNVWYCQLHKVKELLNFEKDVWALILDEKQDDAKAFMEDEDKARIDAFTKDLYDALAKTADRLNWVVIAAKDNLNDSKKRFALEVVPQHSQLEKGLLFSIWDGKEPVALLHEHIRKNLGTGPKLDQVRPLAGGIKWGDY